MMLSPTTPSGLRSFAVEPVPAIATSSAIASLRLPASVYPSVTPITSSRPVSAARPEAPTAASSSGPVELLHQPPHAAVDVVARGAHLLDGPALRVLELPVHVALPGDVRALVAAAHRHDHVGLLGQFARERARHAVAHVDVQLAHDLHHLRVHALAGPGASRQRRVAAAGRAPAERPAHLRAAGVVEADEEGRGHRYSGLRARTIAEVACWCTRCVSEISISSRPAAARASSNSARVRAPAMHPVHSCMSARVASSMSGSAITSETANRPPGFRTRAVSARTLRLSAARLITQFEITTSTESSASGICSM